MIIPSEHAYAPRYRAVWEQTLSQGDLPIEQIERSRYYFESDLTNPTPKEFKSETYGIAALLPMPQEAQVVFTGLWNEVMGMLGHPIAYGVEPQNRHVELLVFARPEEETGRAVAQRNIESSFAHMRSHPPKKFSITYCYPFITPDGTIVAPGYPEPETVIDDIRSTVRRVTDDTLPRKQSQWFHTPLGRILEPLEADRVEPALRTMEARWGELVTRLTIDQLLWTSERQWYMLQKSVLHELALT